MARKKNNPLEEVGAKQFAMTEAAQAKARQARLAKIVGEPDRALGPRARDKSKAKWVMEDLARSGIAKAWNDLRIRYVAGEDLVGLTGLPAGGHPHGIYLLPYFGVNGEFRRFARYRVHPESEAGFKYWQPPDSGVHFYLPPLKGLDWQAIANDPEIPLGIVEGEKKAVRGCLAALHRRRRLERRKDPAARRKIVVYIGIAGVDAFTTRKRRHKDFDGSETTVEGPSRPIADFRLFKWKGRLVYIVYDSDCRTNPNVAESRLRLVALLTSLGARVRVIDLPALGKGKTGLDDFFEARRDDEAAAAELMDLAAPLADGGYAELEEINQWATYIRDEQYVWSTRENGFIDPAKFVNFHLRNRRIWIYDHKSGRLAEKNLGDAWLGWEHRAERRAITYRPFKKEDGDPAPPDKLNVWIDTLPPPIRGPVKPFLELLEYNCADGEDRRALLQWAAYFALNPGKRVLWSPVLVGPQGTGKTLLMMAFVMVFGGDPYDPDSRGNAVIVSGSQLHKNQFNGILTNRLFIGINEAVRSNRGEIADDLKSLIADPTVIRNEKFQPSVEVPNVAAIMFTSNHEDALKIEPGDRHYLVIRCADTKIGDGDPKLLKQFLIWMKSGKAGSHLRWHLENEVDLAGFDPGRAPRFTPAAQAMLESDYDDVTGLLQALDDDHEQLTLRSGLRPMVFTMTEVIGWMTGKMPGRENLVTRQRIAKSSVKPFVRLHGGVVKKMSDGQLRKVHMWCFRREASRLEKLTDAALFELYNAERIATAEEARKKTREVRDKYGLHDRRKTAAGGEGDRKKPDLKLIKGKRF
jgi:hypothetical protein